MASLNVNNKFKKDLPGLMIIKNTIYDLMKLILRLQVTDIFDNDVRVTLYVEKMIALFGKYQDFRNCMGWLLYPRSTLDF